VAPAASRPDSASEQDPGTGVAREHDEDHQWHDRIEDRIKDLELCSLWVRDQEPEAKDKAKAHDGINGAPPEPPTESPPRAFLADLAVYTRNRAMRVMLSSKFGKAAVLAPAGCNRFAVRVPRPPGSCAGRDPTFDASHCGAADASGYGHDQDPSMHREEVQLLLAGEDPTLEAAAVPWPRDETMDRILSEGEIIDLRRLAARQLDNSSSGSYIPEPVKVHATDDEALSSDEVEALEALADEAEAAWRGAAVGAGGSAASGLIEERRLQEQHQGTDRDRDAIASSKAEEDDDNINLAEGLAELAHQLDLESDALHGGAPSDSCDSQSGGFPAGIAGGGAARSKVPLRLSQSRGPASASTSDHVPTPPVDALPSL